MKKFASVKDGRTIYVPENDFEATLLSLNNMPRFSDSVSVDGEPRKAKKIKTWASKIETHIDEAVRKHDANEAGPQAIFAEFNRAHI